MLLRIKTRNNPSTHYTVALPLSYILCSFIHSEFLESIGGVYDFFLKFGYDIFFQSHLLFLLSPSLLLVYI